MVNIARKIKHGQIEFVRLVCPATCNYPIINEL